MFGRWFKRGKPAKPHGDPLQPHGASVAREEPAAADGSTAPHRDDVPQQPGAQQPSA